MTWLRAGFGALAMAIALGTASTASDALTGIPTWLNRLLPALLCTAIAVLLIRPWRRRRQAPTAGGWRPFAHGVAVTGGSAAVMLGAGTAAGWIDWGPFDLAGVLLFILTNAVIAVLLEAFPEELTLRGHTYSALRDGHRPWISAVGTTLLFLLVPGAASVIQALLSGLIGVSAPTPGLAPPGEDPIGYLILLTFFSFTLVAARTSTGSLYASIATHLTFLTVNRLTLLGNDRDSGWSAELTAPDAILLIPGYLLLAAIIYRMTGSRRESRREAAPASSAA
jgi:predicted Abi (CAAX) family protease